MAVAFQVANLGKVFLGDGGHALFDFFLDLGIHFPVVDADEVVFVGGNGATGVEAFGKQAFHLFDTAFVAALFLHDLEQNGQVQRDDGDDRTGTGYQALVHGHVGFALEACLEFGVEFLGGLFQVLLGATDGTVTVDSVGKAGADVGVGHCLDAFVQHARGGELLNPKCPVLAAHHLDGVGCLFGSGGLCADGADLSGHAVDGLASEGFADGFQHAAVHLAGIRVHTDCGGHAVDNQVDLTAHLLHGFDDLLAHVVREGVAVESDRLEACGLGFAVESHVVVPAGSTAFLTRRVGAFLFEGDTDGVGAEFEGGGNTASKPVACGTAHYEDGLRGGLRLATFGFLLLYVLDLTDHVGGTACRVGVDAHVATDHRLNNHCFSFFVNLKTFYPLNFLMTTTPLWPPNPSEAETATSMLPSTPTLGT